MGVLLAVRPISSMLTWRLALMTMKYKLLRCTLQPRRNDIMISYHHVLINSELDTLKTAAVCVNANARVPRAHTLVLNLRHSSTRGCVCDTPQS